MDRPDPVSARGSDFWREIGSVRVVGRVGSDPGGRVTGIDYRDPRELKIPEQRSVLPVNKRGGFFF